MQKQTLLFSLILFLFSLSTLSAQSWSKEEKNVWLQIEKNWLATAEEDLETFMGQLHDDFVGWENNHPAPDDRKATEKWVRYQMAMRETIMHELKPVRIQIFGETAVVHYYFELVTMDPLEKHHITRGRFTDVLMRAGGEWKFITWHGGEDVR